MPLHAGPARRVLFACRHRLLARPRLSRVCHALPAALAVARAAHAAWVRGEATICQCPCAACQLGEVTRPSQLHWREFGAEMMPNRSAHWVDKRAYGLGRRRLRAAAPPFSLPPGVPVPPSLVELLDTLDAVPPRARRRAERRAAHSPASTSTSGILTPRCATFCAARRLLLRARARSRASPARSWRTYMIASVPRWELEFFKWSVLHGGFAGGCFGKGLVRPMVARLALHEHDESASAACVALSPMPCGPADLRARAYGVRLHRVGEPRLAWLSTTAIRRPIYDLGFEMHLLRRSYQAHPHPSSHFPHFRKFHKFRTLTT